MLRIAHVADSHLGYTSNTIPRRDRDFAESWITACRDIVEAKPDLILHAGDVFHRPHPSWGALTDFLAGAALLERADCPIYMISGNHDSSRIVTNHTVFSVISKIAPYLTVSYDDKPNHFLLPQLDAEIILLSHQSLLSRSLRAELESTLAKLGRGSYKILVAHGDIRDLAESEEMGSIVIPDFVFDYPWSYVALGHLHMAQPFSSRGWYSGSIERCGWSDRFANPAWTLVSLTPDGVKHEQRELPYMTMIELPDIDCTGDEEVNISGSVLTSLARVAIPDTRSVARVKLKGVHLYERRRLQSFIQRLVKELYPTLLIQVNVEMGTSLWNATDAAKGHEVASIEEMFGDFVATRVFDDPATSSQLLEVGREAIAKVRAEEAETREL